MHWKLWSVDMQTYLNKVAGLLNAALLVFAVIMMQDVKFEELKVLVFGILLLVTPSFTLFTLFAPTKE
jgi:hypothetical protein